MRGRRMSCSLLLSARSIISQQIFRSSPGANLFSISRSIYSLNSPLSINANFGEQKNGLKYLNASVSRRALAAPVAATAAEGAAIENILSVSEEMGHKQMDVGEGDLKGLTDRNEGILIRDFAELERKKQAIKQAGTKKLQVIADFDMTLTKFVFNGKRGQSCHSLVTTEDEAVNEDRRILHAKYYPKEIDATISFEEKLVFMEEWWAESHRLIVKGGLTMQAIQRSVANANIGFREKSAQMFELLNRHGVPVLIFSAGLADIIEEVLKQKLKRKFENVRVISNRMEFDSSGRLVGFKGRVIHVLNKNEHALELNSTASVTETVGMDSTETEEVLHRTNVVLLGDHLGDLKMSDGVNYDHRITIGFLNDNVEQQLESYLEAFDIVLLNDPSIDKVIDLLKELVASD